MDYKILINKNNKIEKDYNINLVLAKTEYVKNKDIYVEKNTYKNFLKLKKKAKKLNYNIEIESAYRTHEYQKKLFDDLKDKKGIKYASKYVAKPYTSEHETGLAIDFCIYKDNKFIIEHDLTNLIETNWIHENAHKFGFIIRYPENKTNITLYNYEPWHIRFVGKKLAKFLYKNKLTLEEYYNSKC